VASTCKILSPKILAVIIIPAILTETSDEAITQIQQLAPVVEWVQIDVLDGTFLPAQTGTLSDFIGKTADVSVEVHLMVSEPEKYFETCEELGAKRVFFHYEAVPDARMTLEAMHGYGFEKGLVINPATTVEQIEPYLGAVDAMLVMTVEPGRQGAPFVPSALAKVEQIKAIDPYLPVSVDGGVSPENIEKVRETGVDAAGVGSAISRAQDPAAAFQQLQEMAA